MQDNIHTRIKDRRIALGLSQVDLATQTHVSQPTIANWENGSHVPRPLALERISKALDVEPSWLLSGILSEQKNPATDYLSRPIRHVAIYPWPQSLSDIKSTDRLNYVTFASRAEQLVGFMSDGVYAPLGTILLFDFTPKQIIRTRPVLCENAKGLKIVDPKNVSQDGQKHPDCNFKENECVAQLCASLTLYENEN